MIKNRSLLVFAALSTVSIAAADSVTLSSTAPAPTASIDIRTVQDGDIATDATYTMPRTVLNDYVYGNDFILKTSFSNVSSYAVAIQGSHAHYDLAYRHMAAGTTTYTSGVTFGTIGTVTSTTNAQNVFIKGTGTTAVPFDGFDAAGTNATKFAIGARAKASATNLTPLNSKVSILLTLQ